jgi:excisionase family DNA binding protein
MLDLKAPLYTLTAEQFGQLVGEILESRIEKLLTKDLTGSDGEGELIKIGEVCKLLKVSKVTVFAWIKEKKIPCHRIGRRLFFKKQEVINSLKNSLNNGLKKYVNGK